MMKKISNIAIILGLVSFLSIGDLLAQSNCVTTLRDARATYDAGNFHLLPDMLKGCISSGFNPDEKAEAYKLLTLSYIFLNEPENAEEHMLYLLRLEPEHEINEALDPVEFINLYAKFDVDPLFLYGITLSGIYNITHTTAKVPIHDAANYIGRYPASFGFQAGLKGEIFINDQISILPELVYTNRNTSIVYDTLYAQEGQVLAAGNSNYNTQWLRAVALAKYELPLWQMLYAFGGPSFDWMLSSTRTMEGIQSTLPEDLSDISIPFNVSAIIGVGKYFKIGSNYLSLDLRYEFGIREIYSNYGIDQDLAFEQLRNDNQFRLHGISFNIGFLIPRFNPRIK